LPAVAAQGTKNISGKTLRMNPDERRLGVNVSHHQGNGFLRAAVATEEAFKAHDAEMSPARGEVGFGKFADGGF
jgi:hypothetical protein